jgi:hypothetical protein
MEAHNEARYIRGLGGKRNSRIIIILASPHHFIMRLLPENCIYSTNFHQKPQQNSIINFQVAEVQLQHMQKFIPRIDLRTNYKWYLKNNQCPFRDQTA